MFNIDLVLAETSAALERGDADELERARLYAVRRIAERMADLQNQIDIRQSMISELELELMAVI